MQKRKVFVVFKQLVKEFWFPFFAAILWCIYNFTGSNAAPFQIHLILSCFGAAFFFISWLLAQYFRVRKQAKVDNDLQSIHENISSVVRELQGATKDLIGYQTGGESFCYLINSCVSKDSNLGRETVIHQGAHPLFDVTARIMDINEFNTDVKANRVTLNTFTKNSRAYNSLIPGHVHMGNKWNLGDVDQRKFNIFWMARNGSFTQNLYYKKVGGQWHYATKVIRGEKELYSTTSEGYPRNSQGQIDW